MRMRAENPTEIEVATSVEEPSIVVCEVPDHAAQPIDWPGGGWAGRFRRSRQVVSATDRTGQPATTLEIDPEIETMYNSPKPSVPNEASAEVASESHVLESTGPDPSNRKEATKPATKSP